MSKSAGRRRRETAGTRRTVVTFADNAVYASWHTAVWTIVVALDFYWLSNPLVFSPFDESLRNACLATGVGLLLTLPRFRLPRPAWTVLGVLGFGFASALWSTDAGLTVDFTLIYLTVAIVAMLVVANAGSRTIARGMLLGGVIVVLLSIYSFERGLLGTAASPGEGYMAGVGWNRNILSYTVILALPFAVSFLPRTWRGRASWTIGISILLLGLYLTQSATGLVAAMVLCGTAVVLGWYDRPFSGVVGTDRRTSWWLRLAPVAIVAAAAVVFQVFVHNSGRDIATFTGRTPVWAAIWSAPDGWDRWIGVGWGVVWPHPWHPAPMNDTYAEIVIKANIALTHGHNSFFDLLPEIGLLGSFTFAATYVHTAWASLRARRSRSRPTAAQLEASRAALLGVMALLIYGITEPLSTIPLGWFVIVVLVETGRPLPRTNWLSPSRSRLGHESRSRTKIVPPEDAGDLLQVDPLAGQAGRELTRSPSRQGDS